MAEEARPNHLEQDLQAARERGRWLSDEEQEEKILRGAHPSGRVACSSATLASSR